MSDLADLINKNLSTLVHPGDDKTGPIPMVLSMFRNQTLPPQAAQQFAADAGLPNPDIARLFSEALAHVIETDHVVLTRAEVQQLRDAAAANETRRNRVVPFTGRCGNMVFSTNITDYGTDHPRINCSQFIKAVSQLNPDCSTGHAVM